MQATINNPYPPFNLWFILAHLTNHPDGLTNTHYFCIKTMLEVAGDALRKVYGTSGEKLIRVILKDLAEYGVKNNQTGAMALQALAAKFDREGKLL